MCPVLVFQTERGGAITFPFPFSSLSLLRAWSVGVCTALGRWDSVQETLQDLLRDGDHRSPALRPLQRLQKAMTTGWQKICLWGSLQDQFSQSLAGYRWWQQETQLQAGSTTARWAQNPCKAAKGQGWGEVKWPFDSHPAGNMSLLSALLLRVIFAFLLKCKSYIYYFF